MSGCPFAKELTMSLSKFFLATVIVLFASAGCSENKPALPHPDAETFQSGDFLWPALPGAVIPYLRRAEKSAESEAAAWEREKRAFIESARNSSDPEMKAIADELEPLTFAEFQSRYFDGAAGPGPQSRELGPLIAGLPQVGHVAIIEIDGQGKRWVIEAIPKAETRYASLYSRFADGVVRTPYDEWVTIHKEYNVWHGRVKDRPAAERAAIASEAKQFLGKDYWFWSFDLSDENAFYCSKLVWLSVWKAFGLALDGNPAFERHFWVSPKRLINAPTIELLYNPANYGGG